MLFSKYFVLVIFVVLGVAQGQTKFQQGYFVDNENRRTECFIKNIDWIYTPESFEYKKKLEDNPHALTVHDAKEFGVYNVAKFVKVERVPMEMSSNIDFTLTDFKDFVIVEKDVFLKYEVEGMVSLLSYEKHGKLNFFYLERDSLLKPLLYKRYFRKYNTISRNEQYKIDIAQYLKCGEMDSHIRKLRYTRSELTRYFVEYNSCMFGDNVISRVYDSKNTGEVNLTLKGGGGVIPRDFKAAGYPFFVSQAGIEIEYVFPKLHEKFSIVFDPNFSIADTERSTDEYQVKYRYKSLNIPFGGRYYYRIDNKNGLYGTVTLGLRLPLESQRIVYWKQYGYELNSLNSSFTVLGGVGYQIGKKIRAEIKYTSDITTVKMLSPSLSTPSYLYRFQKIDVALGFLLF